MRKMDVDIDNDKKRYINLIHSNKYENILIYGAGRVAKPLYSFLKEEKIEITGFCVTDKSSNKEYEMGLPIYQLRDLTFDKKKTLFLLGVNPRLNKEITDELKKYGYTEYVESSEYLRYYGDFLYLFYKSPVMEITTKIGCSVNCKFCPQDVLYNTYFKTGSEEKEMALETFKKCIDKLPNDTIIQFAGFAEPCLNSEWLNMVLYAKEKGFKMTFFTTLRGMNKEEFEILSKIHFEEFVLHVPDERNYSNIPVNEEYLELLKTVVNCKKENGIDFVDYVSSQAEAAEIVKGYLKDIRVYTALSDRAGNLQEDNLFGAKNVTGKIRCEGTENLNHNVLLPNGNVVLCAQDYGLKHVLGNLLSNSYEDIMNGKVMKELKENMLEDKSCILCRSCDMARNII